MTDLQDINAIVTGGGSGIGAAIATAIAQHGGKTLITGRRSELLEKTKRHIELLYGAGHIEILAGDICDDAHVSKLFAFAKERFGSINCLVNNAATLILSPFTETTMDDFDTLMNTNIRASVCCSKEAFAAMRIDGGVILNISSLAGIQNTEKFKGLSAYTVSKFAVVGLTEALAAEGKEYGIRVHCIAPGAVDTAMLNKAAPTLKTTTTPQHIAQLALGLIDSKNHHITGSIIAVHSNE